MRQRALLTSLVMIAAALVIAAMPADKPAAKKTAKKSVSTVFAAPAQKPPPVVPPDNGGCLSAPKVSYTLPVDAASNDQQDMNCFAWQEFIALNWTASTTTAGQPNTSIPASQFGTPNDLTPKVWETYMDPSDVFRANAMKPIPWGQGTGQTKNTRTKSLGMMSKFDSGAAQLDLSEFTEAFTDSWLTAQNGFITMYEIRLNQDEYNYININGLYNAKTQQTFVQNPGISLPSGKTSYGPVGAIEVKAAWIELDDSSLWPYYKTSKAYVTYPWAPNSPQYVTVGLVGLHIIHKTPNGQQFIWATFEHVNNAPSTADIANNTLLDWYTYYNAACDPSTDHYKCVANAQPTPCTGTGTCDPYNAPVQVVRENPIDTNTSVNNIAGLNYYVWGQIAKANPNSVYLNYQLVNVLWPNNNTTIPAGAQTPLTQGDPQPSPSQEKVANTTLETYFQTTATCLDCHASAPIASVGASKAIRVRRTAATASSGTYASDYSFLFSRAQSPPSTTLTGPVKKKK